MVYIQELLVYICIRVSPDTYNRRRRGTWYVKHAIKRRAAWRVGGSLSYLLWVLTVEEKTLSYHERLRLVMFFQFCDQISVRPVFWHRRNRKVSQYIVCPYPNNSKRHLAVVLDLVPPKKTILCSPYTRRTSRSPAETRRYAQIPPWVSQILVATVKFAREGSS